MEIYVNEYKFYKKKKEKYHWDSWINEKATESEFLVILILNKKTQTNQRHQSTMTQASF